MPPAFEFLLANANQVDLRRRTRTAVDGLIESLGGYRLADLPAAGIENVNSIAACLRLLYEDHPRGGFLVVRGGRAMHAYVQVLVSPRLHDHLYAEAASDKFIEDETTKLSRDDVATILDMGWLKPGWVDEPGARKKFRTANYYRIMFGRSDPERLEVAATLMRTLLDVCGHWKESGVELELSLNQH